MITVRIIGAGLAGCESAWLLANKGYNVELYEMRPNNYPPAHKTDQLAELVCSNSLKSTHYDTAGGLLKEELKAMNSLLMNVAAQTSVEAGSALAVDRVLFSELTTKMIEKHPNIKLIREEITSLDFNDNIHTIVACGPIPSKKLTDELNSICGSSLNFVDAISPIVDASSIDYSKGFFGSRYGKGGDDYFNLPMTKQEFELFYDALIQADLVNLHEFEDAKVFERCMPIEVLASRGVKTMLFGPLRPVGLKQNSIQKQTHAVLQLRSENKDKTAFNLVGFQTKMTIPSQKKVFRLIPGLENANFFRFGSIHLNTYVNAPKVIGEYQQILTVPNLYLAGQITGVEGYIESMASGIITAVQLHQKINNQPPLLFPEYTALGALQLHIKGQFGGKKYTPSNFHFGMLPPVENAPRDKEKKRIMLVDRALEYYKNDELKIY